MSDGIFTGTNGDGQPEKPQPIELPKRAKNVAGEKFGRLRAVYPVRQTYYGVVWYCECDCGGYNEATTAQLRSPQGRGIKSCGCLLREAMVRNYIPKTHGRSKTRLYFTYIRMVRRCHNPDAEDYHKYGAVGIFVVPRWMGPNGFVNFAADMGEPPSKTHSIDRIDNDGPYSPGNCRWATKTEQTRNRSNTIMVVFRGEKRPLAELAESFSLPYRVVHDRIFRSGWDLETTLTTPVRKWTRINPRDNADAPDRPRNPRTD